jgi:hypothetical protein
MLSDGRAPPAGDTRPPGLLRTLKAVLWGFLGIRRGAGYREDAARLKPAYVIVAGLLAAAVFVVVLITIVRWAVAALS